MESKTIFRIDGKKINNSEDFFRQLSRKLFPDVHGWSFNLDGLNDMLGGGFGTPENGCILIWDNHNCSRECLGYEETIRVLENRQKKSHQSARSDIFKRIRMAQRHEGPTIFDDIVELFEQHRPEKGQKYSVDLRLG